LRRPCDCAGPATSPRRLEARVYLELAPTTLAQLIGHADAGFTLRVYARDTRDTAAVVADVLKRASAAGFGGSLEISCVSVT
jgi:hypothetical protein